MTIGFRERRSVMVGRAIVAAETACSPKFPHSAHLVSRPVNKCSIADAAFDLMGGFGPAEGFGIFVPVGQEAGDGLLQARGAVEAAAANSLRGDQAEPALDQVEPRGAGRGEVQMESRVRGQPLFDRGMLV